MDFLIDNGFELFFLFTFPFIGFGLDHFFSRKNRFYVLLVSTILLSPILTGYSYRIDYLYQIFGIISLGAVYSFCSALIDKKAAKIATAIIFSVLLLGIFGFAAFVNDFAGSQTVEEEWEIDHYKVEYVCDQGFAGSPQMKYELSKFSLIPIFVKRIETRLDQDTTGNCYVYFEKSKLVFNKCEGTIVEE